MLSAYKNSAAEAKVRESYEGLLKSWGVAFREVSVEGEFGTTHCVVTGDEAKAPLVLFHGSGDNSAVRWLLNIKALAERFHCFAVDTIGGPGKSHPSENYGKTFNQTEWITNVLDYLHIDKANLVGAANGAAMAYNYFTVKPERVLKAVCIGSGMILDPHTANADAVHGLFGGIFPPSDANIRKALKKLVSPQSTVFDEHPEILDHFVLALQSHNQSAMNFHKINPYDASKDAAFRDKILFLLGDHDQDDRKALTDLLRQGKYRFSTIKNAGYGLNYERAAETNQAIIDFIG